MERGATSELLQSLPPQGLPSPYSQHGDSRSEASPQDNPLAHHYTQSEARQSHYTTATPTSDYSGYPASARSGSFPEHQLQRAFPPSAASMASHSSSLNLQDGADAAHQDPHEDPQQLKSDPDVPIDPSITAQSPTQYYPQTSPYGAAGDMSQHYGHPSAVYSQPQPRPDWTGYNAHTPITPNHHGVFQHQQTTPTAARGGPGNQVSLLSCAQPHLTRWMSRRAGPHRCRYLLFMAMSVADIVVCLGVFVCAHSWFTAAQATTSPLRGD